MSQLQSKHLHQTEQKIFISRKDCKYRRILTGSPVTKSPLDLFSQCQFLDPWLQTINPITRFVLDILSVKIQVNGRQVEIVVGYRNLAKLSEKIKPSQEEY